jgi:hypothetical protein
MPVERATYLASVVDMDTVIIVEIPNYNNEHLTAIQKSQSKV